VRRITRRTAVVAAALTVTLSGGAAFAYWLNTGSATATGQTASGTKLTVTNLTTTDPAMVPGASQSWTFRVNNDGANPLTIDTTNSSVVVTPFSSTAVDATKSACTQADYTITNVALPASVYSHSYGDGSFTLTFSNDLARDQVNCQSYAVPLNVLVKAA